MENINETKQKLIDSAMRLFKRHGYANVTIEQICDAVGISKNTYYYHFESKDSLLLAYLNEKKDLTMQTLTDVLFTEKNNFEKFWILQKKGIDIMLDCGIDIICHLRDMKTIHSALNARYQQEDFFSLQEKIISAAQADGSVRNQADSRALVAASALQFFGVLSVWIVMNGAFDCEKVMRSCFENILDVRPDLRCGGDLYEYFLNVKEKHHAR